MEDEDKKQIPHDECPSTTLNLNVPLLSTRRPFGDKPLILAPAHTVPTDPAKMVPFSWERIPGEPKDSDNLAQNLQIVVTPPPKLPPGHWHPTATEEEANERGDDEIITSGSSCHKAEVDYVDDHSDRFSDAIDIFSLAESTEEDCRGATSEEDRSRSPAILPELGNRINGGGYYTPNFMIQRFLPDAQALAEESVTNKATLPLSNFSAAAAAFSKALNMKRSYHHHQQPPKLGCGLGSFLPWKMKPKPCGVKSPVCDTIIGPSDHKQNPR